MDFDITKLFDSFDSPDSIAILFFLLIAFILGLLVGYLLRTPRVLKLKRELRDKKKELEEQRAEIERLKEQLNLRDADLKRSDFAVEELQGKANRLEEEKTNLYNEVYASNAEVEKLHATNKAYALTIEDLNNQIAGLQSKNEELVDEIEIEEEGVNDLAQIQSIYNATRSRLEAVEQKLEHLDTENKSLRYSLDEIKGSSSVIYKESVVEVKKEESPVIVTESTDLADQEPEFELVKDKAILSQKIMTEEHEKDDLTLISGIGPFIEKKLNEIGAYTYQQISEFDAATIQQVTKDIGYLPGRIEHDDWVGQAKRLHEAKQDDPLALQPLTNSPYHPKDLKVIEGIGPKIEQILKDEGIYTWKDLAEVEIDRLREILQSAGDRFRMHDPGTWPAQARLATNGEWALLKEYQEELKGGREI